MYYADIAQRVFEQTQSHTAVWRTYDRLIALREGLSSGPQRIPAKCDSHLLLGTWNVREFGANSKEGIRSQEALYYIAEIISRFDLVAIQEAHRNLEDLDRVLRILGRWWNVVFTDATEGRRGNHERMAFVYDTRKVTHGGLAGEVVIPPKRAGRRQLQPAKQLYRTPFIAGFRSRWTRFMISTVHIVYGQSIKNSPTRIAEIDAIAGFLATRGQQATAWARNLVVLGDFNIFDRTARTYECLLDHGFSIPSALQTVPATNVGKKKRFYDQIAVLKGDERFAPTAEAGVFDFYEYVFRDGSQAHGDTEEHDYAPVMGNKYKAKKTDAQRHTYYRKWRTFQMSDHLPMWIQLRTDFSAEYLQRKLNEYVVKDVQA